MPGPDLAIIFACYGQPKMMRKQEETWASWPIELAKRTEILVVDDCGDPAYEVSEDLEEDICNLRIYRVDKNIPWNQMGARNLGQKEAEAPWRLMLDPDMLLTAPNLARILEMYPKFRQGTHYKPKLQPCKQPYGSPNLYIVHEHDFWKAGGYNEDFAGAKGYSDVVLHRTLAALSRRVLLDKIWLRFVNRKEIPDADVRTLDRNLRVNGVKFRRAVNFAGKNGKNGWKLYSLGVKNHVRFPWHRVR